MADRLSAFFTSLAALLVLVPFSAQAQIQDGEWLLTVEGNELMVFGTSRLAGGLRVQWQTQWTFVVDQGRFKSGSGSSQLINEPEPFSRPGHMFECTSEEGTFVSASQQIHTTPHVRLAGFPVAGAVEKGQVILESTVDFPGNYVAVVYRCETENSVGDIWLQRGPLVGLERARRQNAETRTENGKYLARIKEVRMIPPQGRITVPLIDGWTMESVDDTRERAVSYSLKRLVD